MLSNFFRYLHQRRFRFHLSDRHLLNNRRFLSWAGRFWRLGYPVMLLVFMLQTWKDSGGAISLFVLWLLLAAILRSAAKTRAGLLSTENISGRMQKLRRGLLKLLLLGIGRINTPSSSKSTIKNRLLAIATLLSAH